MSEIILKVTLMYIARELNITAATVSRALNDYPAINQPSFPTVLEPEKITKQILFINTP